MIKVIENIHFIAVAFLMLIGFYAIIFRRNLIKIAMGASIIASGINLFLIAIGYRHEGVVPIFTSAAIKAGEAQAKMVLPVPQALTLTSIVISLAVTALMLSFAVVIYKKTNTLDIKEIKEALNID